MRHKRRIEERSKILKFLSAFRRPVGKDHLIKTREDYIEYFKIILYIKERIDLENKKLERERIWYALWRSMLWSIVFSMGVCFVCLFASKDIIIEYVADIQRFGFGILYSDLFTLRCIFIGVICIFCWFTWGNYYFEFKSRSEKSIPIFTIYDCTKMYNGYCGYRYRSYNVLADCYALKSFYSKERYKYELHLINYADVETYMLLADAMLVATSETYSLRDNKIIERYGCSRAEIMQVYNKESHYSEHWCSDAYIPSEIIDLLNETYNTTTSPLSINECVMCGIKLEFKVEFGGYTTDEE